MIISFFLQDRGGHRDFLTRDICPRDIAHQWPETEGPRLFDTSVYVDTDDAVGWVMPDFHRVTKRALDAVGLLFDH
jgi:hypothetical protein